MTRARRRLGEQIAEQVAALPAEQVPPSPPEITDKPTQDELVRWLGSKLDLLAQAADDEFAYRLLPDVISCLRTPGGPAHAEPFSLLGAVMTCARLRLRPINGRAWIRPFWDATAGRHRARLVLGYLGYIDIAFRTGLVRSMCARPVHEGESFDIDYGTAAVRHQPIIRGHAGPAYGYYAQVEHHTGGAHPLYLSREQIETHRDRSVLERAENQERTGLWRTHYDDMASRTVLRLLLHELPADPIGQPLATCLAVDGGIRIDHTPDADPTVVSYPLDEVARHDPSRTAERTDDTG